MQQTNNNNNFIDARQSSECVIPPYGRWMFSCNTAQDKAYSNWQRLKSIKSPWQIKCKRNDSKKAETIYGDDNKTEENVCVLGYQYFIIISSNFKNNSRNMDASVEQEFCLNDRIFTRDIFYT